MQEPSAFPLKGLLPQLGRCSRCNFPLTKNPRAQDTMDLVQEYVAAHGVEADLRFGGAGVQWFTNRDRTSGESAHATCLLHAEQCGDPYCGRSELLDSAEAEERMKSPEFLGAIFQPAGGSIWGAKIVFALLFALLWGALHQGRVLRNRVHASRGALGEIWATRRAVVRREISFRWRPCAKGPDR